MLTNTWISFLTFILAVKIGSAILGVSWQETRSQAAEILQKFTWSSFFKLSGLKLFAPVLIGYLVVSLTLGLLAYLVTLVTIWIIKRRAICR
jgi:uncharacterized protein (DUF2062 family)